MKSPQQKLFTAKKNLRIITQVTSRTDLTMEEMKLLKGMARSFELSVALNERRLAEALSKLNRHNDVI